MGAIDTSDGECCRPATRQRATPLRRPLSQQLAAVILWIERQIERRRSRRALLSLNDQQLKDIGLSRSDVYREASRHFWE